MLQKLQEEYMDIYEGIHSEIVSSNRIVLIELTRILT